MKPFGSNCEHSPVRRRRLLDTVLIHCSPRQVKSPCNSWPLAVVALFFAATTDETQPQLQSAVLRLSATFASTSDNKLYLFCSPPSNDKVI